jgi:hypothetical protein
MTIVSQYAATATITGQQVTSTAPLFFELNTQPNPIRVSPSTGDPERADLILVGSRRSTLPIECRAITITIPTGTNSADLTPDLNSISAQISLPDWTPRTDANAKTITFTPASGHTLIERDQGITIQLMGTRINTEVGSAPLHVTLSWREHFPDNDNDPWSDGVTTFDVGKFPPGFRMDNFKADRLIVDNSDTITLTWEASGASSLKLLYDAAEINVLNHTTHTVPNLTHTTVFYLRGTVQAGNNTVERTLTCTVTVQIPDLTVSRLTVLDEIAIPAPPPTANADAILGVDPEHPLENMFDGRLDTYYLSATAGVLGFGSVTVDRGSNLPLHTVDIDFGDENSPYGPGITTLYTFTDGEESWTIRAGATGFVLHFSADDKIECRYIRVGKLSANKLAIRSFQIDPPAEALQLLQISPNTADFRIPVNAYRGIDT